MTTDHADRDPGASMRTALANAMVSLKKRYHGEGSTGAEAWTSTTTCPRRWSAG
jgi:hypothetical protein